MHSDEQREIESGSHIQKKMVDLISAMVKSLNLPWDDNKFTLYGKNCFF